MILDAAAKLATVEGLEGLSIGRLAGYIGMSKSGLFAHFHSKEELQLATVAAAFDVFREAIITPSLSVADPIERVEAVCNGFLDYLESRVFPGGCFFAVTATEFGSRPGPVRDSLAEIQGGWDDMLAALFRQAQDSGQISAQENPEQLAFEVSAYLLMANQHFILQDDESAPKLARRLVHACLAGLRPNKRPEAKKAEPGAQPSQA
jgi:AcrR family transcriptional regulator